MQGAGTDGWQRRSADPAGVLHALSTMLSLKGVASATRFFLGIIVGTSAGALNAVFLASRANRGLQAFSKRASFWPMPR